MNEPWHIRNRWPLVISRGEFVWLMAFFAVQGFALGVAVAAIFLTGRP